MNELEEALDWTGEDEEKDDTEYDENSSDQNQDQGQEKDEVKKTK